MLVPVGRQHDWIFSTQTGHLLLLLLLPLNPHQQPPLRYPTQTQTQTPTPALHPLHFGSRSDPPVPEQHPPSPSRPLSQIRLHIGRPLHALPLLTRRRGAHRLRGPPRGPRRRGDTGRGRRARRRRVSPAAEVQEDAQSRAAQSQVRRVTNSALNAAGGTFRPETGSLVQSYLGPMVAGLSLLAPDLLTVKALCLGVGGGDILICVGHQFGFNVIGVEADNVVLRVAKCHFGLIEDEWLMVVVGDGIELIESESNEEFLDAFDVIMVDLDSGRR